MSATPRSARTLRRARTSRPARQRPTARLAGVGLIAVLAIVAGCTTSPRPEGQTVRLQATRITNVSQLGDWPTTFWDPDSIEEPYLVHLGLRLSLSSPITVSTFVSSTYENNGAYIAKVGPGESVDIASGDGATFAGVQLPDVADLGAGSKLEILGSIEFLMERDQLIPVGIVNVLQGVSQLINAALPPILANGGIPSTLQGIADLIGAVLPSVVTTVLGLVGSVLGGIAGGDQLIGISPQFFIAAGGGLAGFLNSALPSLLGLVNFALSLQDPNPFPNGLPLGIGVVGSGPQVRFGTAPATSVYDVAYGWDFPA